MMTKERKKKRSFSRGNKNENNESYRIMKNERNKQSKIEK